jgi:SAM-dependent methyltransferase
MKGSIEKMYQRPYSELATETIKAPYRFYLEHLTLNDGSIGIDIGSNSGTALSLPEMSRHKVIGSDINFSFVKKLQEHRDGGLNINLTATELPFASGSVDFAILNHVIEHIPQSFQPQTISEIKRILNPDHGVLFLATPNANSRPKWSIPYSPDHLHELGKDELITMLQQYFPNIDLYGQRFLPSGMKYFIYHAVRSLPTTNLYFYHQIPAPIELFVRHKLLKGQQAASIRKFTDGENPRAIVTICHVR